MNMLFQRLCRNTRNYVEQLAQSYLDQTSNQVVHMGFIRLCIKGQQDPTSKTYNEMSHYEYVVFSTIYSNSRTIVCWLISFARYAYRTLISCSLLLEYHILELSVRQTLTFYSPCVSVFTVGYFIFLIENGNP